MPDEGKYDGDMVLFEGALWIYSGDDWIEVGGAVDVSDFALKSANKVQRVEDNLDLIKNRWCGQVHPQGQALNACGPW